MTADSRMAAMILSSPPQFGQCSISISKTRLSSRAQLIRAGRPCAQPDSVAMCSDSPVVSSGPAGTTNARSLAEIGKYSASTPWKRIRCSRGRGTGAWGAPFGRPCGQALHELQRRHHDVGGALVPGGLKLEHDLPGSVALHAFVGQGRPRDVAAKLLQPLALVGAAAHGGVQAEPLLVGAQRLGERGIARHRALHREHLLPGAWAEGDSIRRARTQTVQWTVCAWQGAGPLARRGLQGHAAACSGLSVRASSESPSLSAR